MKRHRDITISSPCLDAAALARYVESFAERAMNWECPIEKSQAYERACGEPSCCVVVKAPGLEHAAVSLSKVRQNALRKTNIVPLDRYELDIDQYPLSGHPSDVERLDKFICSIARYSKKPFDLHAFQHLLVEELGWSEVQAGRCRSRVEIGLEVLATYKRF